jgi:flagellar hook-basal body complex protein FliE
MAGVPSISGFASPEINGLAQSLEGAGSDEMRVGPGAEARVLREMQRQGMDVPAVGTGNSGVAEAGKGFMDVLQKAVDGVNQDQVQADHAIKELVAGRSKNIHETMLAIERADSSLKLMMQVRNKVLDAYREIMRMQV